MEEGDLGVHELHGGKLLQLDQHVVQDVLHLLLVVAVVRLYPACNVRCVKSRGGFFGGGGEDILWPIFVQPLYLLHAPHQFSMKFHSTEEPSLAILLATSLTASLH